MPNEQTSVPLFASGEVLTAANMNISAGTGVPVFATTTTRDAAFGGTGEKVLAEGQLCYLSSTNVVQYYDGAAWATVGPSTTTTQMAIFNESQAAGTDGGTSTSGSFIKRTLNTTVINTITGCSIASSVITLPAGTFYVSARSPGSQATGLKSKLRNTTDSTDLASGSTMYNPAATSVMIDTTIQGYFVLAASKTVELQQRCNQGTATNGLGIAAGMGVDEIYSSITITKVA